MTGMDMSSQMTTTVATMMPPAVCKKPLRRTHMTEMVSLNVGS